MVVSEDSDLEILEVDIEKIVPGGYGLGYTKSLAVFVPLASEGDKLKVRVYKRNAQTAFAEIVEITEPSRIRQKPICRYFGECGGCDFQHLPYSVQLEKKVEIIRDCLQRIGKIQFNEITIIPSKQTSGYRLRAQWHIDVESKRVGYFRRNSNNVVDVETCPILAPKLQEFLSKFRSQVIYRDFQANKKIHVDVATDGKNVCVFSENFPTEADKLSIKVGVEKYFFNSKVFFQANRFLLEKLIKTALEDVSGEVALDLYCGVGFFTLPLARRFKKVLAIEENAEAVEFAIKNAKVAELENIEFFTNKTGEFFSKKVGDLVKETSEKFDFVLLDPPRTGTEKKVIEELLRLEPKHICYVSCDPATLARDLRKLLGKYDLISITAIDLFPQTHHVEVVAKLQRR
jgi:23S rRNA (uracil1939-C5)-methyltransferase